MTRDDSYLHRFMRSVVNGAPLDVVRADLQYGELFRNPDKVANVSLADARRMRDESEEELGEDSRPRLRGFAR